MAEKAETSGTDGAIDALSASALDIIWRSISGKKWRE